MCKEYFSVGLDHAYMQTSQSRWVGGLWALSNRLLSRNQTVTAAVVERNTVFSFTPDYPRSPCIVRLTINIDGRASKHNDDASFMTRRNAAAVLHSASASASSRMNVASCVLAAAAAALLDIRDVSSHVLTDFSTHTSF